MPAVFAGHGSPMNAIEENEFHIVLRQTGQRLPRPEAILCVSAHWETDGVRVTAGAQPPTIHDFSGFPPALHQTRYPAPGQPALAHRVAQLLPEARPHESRGFDHGCWGVLLPMYPEANIPVVQLSLDRRRSAKQHYDLAAALAPLRDEGILIIGSGNIVHNLARLDFSSPHGSPWAVRFNDEVKQHIEAANQAALTNLDSTDARLAVPTPEHFLPLLYTLAVRHAEDQLEWFNDATTMGSISMTSLILGN
ncbi:MAG: 4,5-DOPA dioxygenase extradiol [Acidobacteria bacterium]|nr:4,5-DOPA dioxygenase extradiol [Acidobacteriota bacterium]